MKILLCHNFYQQPGGEDQCFEAEARLLEAGGHEVARCTAHNDAINGMGRLDAARRTFWNAETYARVRALIRRERPAVVHCTNTFPLLSPALYYAARAEGVPVVQALHNYRLLCPNGLFLRDGRVCEDCLHQWAAWPGVLHGCYRGDRAATAVVAAMTAGHRALRTWTRAVDLYYTPSEFARRKFIQAGMAADHVAVKPNFVAPDPGPGAGRGDCLVFVGRLSPEKGLDVLLGAWARMRQPVRLRLVGDGPLADVVRAACSRDPRIEWLGWRPPEEVLSILGEAACLVMPSTWYETFGRTIIEAFARGTPVVASRLGAMAELVDDGQTGRLFAPGDPADLALKVRELLADSAKLGQMREAARKEYERKYTAEINYHMLLTVYERAVLRKGPRQKWKEHTEDRKLANEMRREGLIPLSTLRPPLTVEGGRE